MQGDVALSVEGVSKSYGTLVALDGVSLEVRAGEFVALLGPNGAGKSTLMGLMTGLFAADTGTIRILGADTRRELTKALPHLGVVFQLPTLDLELTVEDNLLYHSDLHGIPRREARRRINELLARFDLEERRRSRARTLSGGNRRRVELARALLHQPSILLMDEATVGLDPASRRDLLELILVMCHEDGLGVLWATHLVDEVEEADRVVVLHRGRILFDGTPERFLMERAADSISDAFFSLTGPPVENGHAAEPVRVVDPYPGDAI